MLSRTRGEAENDVAVQPYEMQKTMWDEMERRRVDWEKEMQRMQEDFFQVGDHYLLSNLAVNPLACQRQFCCTITSLRYPFKPYNSNYRICS